MKKILYSIIVLVVMTCGTGCSPKKYVIAPENAEALYKLGLSYEEGKDVKKDLAKAIECYQKSANLGYAGAQCRLGYCYEVGKGLEKDTAKALEWYHKSADQCYATA